MNFGLLDVLFVISNLTVAVNWTLLIFFPFSKAAKKIVHTGYLSIFAALIYSFAVVCVITPSVFVDFFVFSWYVKLFANEYWLLAAWYHFAVFDTFAGSWMVCDSKKFVVSQWVLGPILFITAFLGPIGFLIYFTIRKIRGGKELWS